MENELIDYNKFHCIFETVIKDRLLSIFYQRWLIESGEPWKYNVAFGSVVRNKLPLVYNEFDDDTKSYIDNGYIFRLDFKDLVSILLNSNNLNKNYNHTEIIIKQNNLIQKLDDYYKENIKNNTKIEFNQSIEFLINYIILLENTNNNNISDINIKTEINNIFNNVYDYGSGSGSGKVNNNNNNKNIYNSKINFVNEKKVIELNEKGLIEFKAKNFQNSMVYFKNALKFENISHYIKSELLLNNGISILEFSKFMVFYNFDEIKDTEDDYRFLHSSKNFIFNALKHRPCWGMAYFKLGIVQSRLGDYHEAIKSFNCALILDNDGDKSNLKSQVNKWINEVNEKIKIKSIDIHSKKRNFDKEAKLIIEKYGCLNQFKNIQIKFEELVSLDLMDLAELSITTGILPNLIFQRMMIDFVYTEQSLQEIKFDIFKSLISCDTIWAEPYYQLIRKLNELVKKESEPPNGKLTVSLFLKASLLPLILPQQQINKHSTLKIEIEDETHYTHNKYVLICNSWLGIIYRYGLYGEDVDLEKSQYYLELSIKNHETLFKKMGKTSYLYQLVTDVCSYSFYYLARLFYSGLNKDRVEDLEKAKKLFRIGCEMGNPDCILFLKKYFDESVNQTNVVNYELQKKSEGYIIGQINIENDQFSLSYTIDFNTIKEITENPKTPQNEYAKRIYSTYLKVVKFIKSFKSLDLKKSNLKDKLESIKILASAFRDYENYFLIRIPPTIINDVNELVGQLLKSSPSNMDVRVCWLGFSRMFFNMPFKFIDESLQLCKNENDYLFFKYYQILFYGYDGDVDTQFNILIKLLLIGDNNVQQQQQQEESQLKLTNPVDKDNFLCLLLSIIKSLPQTSKIEISIDQLNCIIQRVDSFNSRLIKGNPQNVEINLNLCLLLLWKYKINKNNLPRYKISQYFEIGESSLDWLIPSIDSSYRNMQDTVFSIGDLDENQLYILNNKFD